MASPATLADATPGFSLDYGTKVVAGVTPGKARPGFRTWDAQGSDLQHRGGRRARDRRHCLSAIFSCRRPLRGMPFSSASTPALDLCRRRDHRRNSRARHDSRETGDAGRARTRLVGPNCPGLVTPGTGRQTYGGCRIGIAPGYIHKKRPRRRGLALRHAHLRGGLPSHHARARPKHLRRHRRRPRQRHLSSRCAHQDVQRRPPRRTASS